MSVLNHGCNSHEERNSVTFPCLNVIFFWIIIKKKIIVLKHRYPPMSCPVIKAFHLIKGDTSGVLWRGGGAEKVLKKVCFWLLPKINSLLLIYSEKMFVVCFSIHLYNVNKFVVCFSIHLYNVNKFVSGYKKKMFIAKNHEKNSCFRDIIFCPW